MTTIRVSAVVLAEAPDDGGRWALYCDHLDEATGEWLNGGLIQDTNKARLATWRKAKFSDGLTEWCAECQELTTDPRQMRLCGR